MRAAGENRERARTYLPVKLLKAFNQHQQGCIAYQGTEELAPQHDEELAPQQEATIEQERDWNAAASIDTTTANGISVVIPGTHQPPSTMDGATPQAHIIYFLVVHASHHQTLQELINSGATEMDLQAAAFRWIMAAPAGAHDHA